MSELTRFNRQIMLQEVMNKGQDALKKTKVTLVGLGGLGCPAALYLTYAGIGNICLIDKDEVDLSNLNRQTLYYVEDIGKKKVLSAKKKLLKVNPEVHIETIIEELNDTNATKLLTGSDVVLDCLDNLPSKLALNRACFKLGLPFVHGAVYGFDGQVSLFIPGKTPCLECYLKLALKDNRTNRPFPVIGTTPGLIGIMQALEVIKYILQLESPMKGNVFILKTLSFEQFKLKIKKNDLCTTCMDL